MAYIGCGTQGIRELLRWIAVPDVQITAVCDPVKDATNYIDWDKTGLRDSVRKTLGDPNWGGEYTGIRAGRDVAKNIIETYYAKQRAAEKFRSVASYVDFRELLEKERDLDSVKIMTPDHLHATISLAAMRKRKHVIMHKPLSNRVAEVRMVVDAARKSEWPRTCWPGAGRSPRRADDPRRRDRQPQGDHDWTDRPYWPQELPFPTDTPPFRRTSTGRCGWDRSAIARTTRPIRTPSSAAGTISVAAASRTWATTACGRSTWRSTCPCRTASRRSPTPAPASSTR
jgi:hypothetical protein